MLVDVRLGSPHRPQTRTCSNQLAHAAGTGELPVGAASLKEMYDDTGRTMGYGASRKVEAGGAPPAGTGTSGSATAIPMPTA